MVEINNINQIIFSYLAGKTNIEEVQILRKWLNESPTNKKQFKIIKNYWENNRWEIEVDDKDKLFEKLKHKIQLDNTPVISIKYQPPKREVSTHRYRLIGIAASFLLLISAGIYFFQTEFNQPAPINQVATIIKQNPAGQKSRITLPDGTTVWLNSESSISYPESFNSTQRDIDLQGEAYFEVSKDALRPFTVHSGHFDVTVLGTSFDIASYTGDQSARVSLIEGQVRVNITNQNALDYNAVYLKPGEELMYNKLSNQIQKHSFDLEYVVAWKEGILVLNNNTFPELKEKLERWYGVTINVEGTPPDNFIVKGKFEDEYLDNVFKTLQFGRHFSYTINDNIILIKFNLNSKSL